MSITDVLNRFENSLRQFVEDILIAHYGENYVNLSNFQKYKEKWEGYKRKDEKERLGGFEESRLIFYSSIGDLKKIINSHWPVFEPWLRNQIRIELMLDEIISVRDADAHRRDIAENEEKRLELNCNDILKLIDDYWRLKTSIEDFNFPVIIEIIDSLGNVNKNSWAKKTGGSWSIRRENPKVRVGDEIKFLVYAYSYKNEPLEYKYSVQPSGKSFVTKQDWCSNNTWTWKVIKEEIGLHCCVMLAIRNKRDYHALGEVDDYTYAIYDVLPSRKD